MTMEEDKKSKKSKPAGFGSSEPAREEEIAEIFQTAGTVIPEEEAAEISPPDAPVIVEEEAAPPKRHTPLVRPMSKRESVPQRGFKKATILRA